MQSVFAEIVISASVRLIDSSPFDGCRQGTNRGLETNMKRAILLGATGMAVAVAMLAGGFLAAQPEPALAGDTPSAVDGRFAPIRSTARRSRTSSANICWPIPNCCWKCSRRSTPSRRKSRGSRSRRSSSDAKDKIYKSAHDGIVGNPNGKVTIVEFFDYNCGYCKRAIEDMQAMTAADPDLRFVLKEFPILGPDSQKASVVSMAFHNLMPEKYGEFHNQLLGGHGRAGEATAIKIAVSLGADEAKLREAMKDPRSTRSSTRPTNSPTSCRSPARHPTWSATRWCSARRAATCSTEKLAVAKAACAALLTGC